MGEQGRRIATSITAALAALLLATASPVSAASEFPAGWEGYHTYAETDAFLASAVATYGQGSGAILKRRVIGKSYEGRDIWVVKISDRVNRDEGEPEVLAECGLHAREILTIETCLYMIDLLTQNYGQSTPLGQRVTQLVNTREIWIVPNTNPDGSEFNISGGTFHNWRKNRQPIPGTNYVGIDLNRNWDFMWGSKGSSAKPRAGTYRGQFPFQAKENQVLRDFILSRRVGGLQQIRAAFNWHSYGLRIMWPYGYTKDDVPPTMTMDDHDALVEIGRQMASRNNYKAQQGSDLYIYSGDFPGWAYATQRIFIYTFEIYPGYGCEGCGGFHPPDHVIASQTTRNQEAILYFLEQADCVYRSIGLGATHCGPMNEDFEVDRGWRVNANRTDDATSGTWQRGLPEATADGAGPKQRANVPSGQTNLVTGRTEGSAATDNDIDGGTTSVRSRSFKLGSGSWTMEFKYTFAHDASATSDDFLRVSVISGGVTTPVWTELGQAANRDANWTPQSVSLTAWHGKTIRLLIEARDGGADNLVEAAVDDLRVHRP
jgi:hypothetical protein